MTRDSVLLNSLEIFACIGITAPALLLDDEVARLKLPHCCLETIDYGLVVLCFLSQMLVKPDVLDDFFVTHGVGIQVQSLCYLSLLDHLIFFRFR